MKRAGLVKSDLCRLCHVTEPTMMKWINDPSIIPLGKVIVMAGLFGIPAEELFYCLLRNKPQIPKSGKWYLEDIRLRVNKEEGV
ncbi:MAG: hypothetical protein V4721_10320 [Bacteroidota bacterium]